MKAHAITVILWREKNMGRESSHGLMDPTTLETSTTESMTARESTILQTQRESTRENSKHPKCMAMAKRPGRTEDSTRASIKMERKRGEEPSTGPMVISIKESGKMISKTD